MNTPRHTVVVVVVVEVLQAVRHSSPKPLRKPVRGLFQQDLTECSVCCVVGMDGCVVCRVGVGVTQTGKDTCCLSSLCFLRFPGCLSLTTLSDHSLTH